MVNESGFDGIVDNIKALFCYDRLSNMQKDEVAEIFKPYNDGVIYGTIMKFSKILIFQDQSNQNSTNQWGCVRIYIMH